MTFTWTAESADLGSICPAPQPPPGVAPSLSVLRLQVVPELAPLCSGPQNDSKCPSTGSSIIKRYHLVLIYLVFPTWKTLPYSTGIYYNTNNVSSRNCLIQDGQCLRALVVQSLVWGYLSLVFSVAKSCPALLGPPGL